MVSYVVTGSNRGIGFEFVRQLSADPNNVVFAIVRNLKTTDNLKALDRSNVHILEADVTDFKALKAAAEFVSKVTGGNLDVLINNAAFIDSQRNHHPLHGYAEGDEAILEEDLLANFKVNTIGVIHTTNAFLSLVKAGSTKKVVLISSGAGDLDFTINTEMAISGPYSISKAAANMAFAKYTAQYKKEGIIFLSICPGFVDTTEGKPISPELAELYKSVTESLQRAYPNAGGAMTPQVSVGKVMGLVNNATIKDSGAYISHKGNKEWA